MAKQTTSKPPIPKELETILVCGVPISSAWGAKRMAKVLHVNNVTSQDLRACSKQIEDVYGRPFYVQLLTRLNEYTPQSQARKRTANTSPSLSSNTNSVKEKSAQYIYSWCSVVSSNVSGSNSVLKVQYKDTIHQIILKTKLKTVPEKVTCVICNGEVTIDEYWLYKHCKLYELNSEYAFKVVKSRPYGKSREYVVLDRLMREQIVVSRKVFEDGDTIVCTIRGFQKRPKHVNSLALMNARLYENAPAKHTPKPREYTTPVSFYPNGKGPEAWRLEVRHLGHHTATNPFKCSCCGRNFSSRQGCKVELRDIYFCKACADQIFKHSDKGYLRIVYTPMGNKR